MSKKGPWEYMAEKPEAHEYDQVAQGCYAITSGMSRDRTRDPKITGRTRYPPGHRATARWIRNNRFASEEVAYKMTFN